MRERERDRDQFDVIVRHQRNLHLHAVRMGERVRHLLLDKLALVRFVRNEELRVSMPPAWSRESETIRDTVRDTFNDSAITFTRTAERVREQRCRPEKTRALEQPLDQLDHLKGQTERAERAITFTRAAEWVREQ